MRFVSSHNAKIVQGTIVRANVVDPQGNNPKIRPLVVVTPTHEITPDATLVAVAITGRFSDPLAVDEVMMPYNPNGTSISKLRKRCVAKCSWMCHITMSNVIEVKGSLRPRHLVEILKRINKLPK